MIDFTPNHEQKAAIENIDGPMLVLAGPGTGKTQLLSARVAHILQNTDTLPSSILCLTYTDSGAQAMRDRLTSFIKEDAYQVEINTYHGFSQTIIAQNRDYFVDQHLEKVADDITRYSFVSELQNELPTNSILKNIDPRDILSTISNLKQALISPEKLLAVADENKSQIDQVNQEIRSLWHDFNKMPTKLEAALSYFAPLLEIIQTVQISKSCLPDFPPLLQILSTKLEAAITEAEASDKGKTKPLTTWKNQFLDKNSDGEWEIKDNFNDIRLRTLQQIYAHYNQKMLAAGLYDFDDMIIKTIETIEQNPDLKFNLQEKYLYILLDEYQDTNQAQSRLIELLTDNPVNEGRPNIMAVGDDDQAIYAFQGALFSNMLDFFHRYRDTKLINLTQNYRSHQDVLSAAAKVATQIDERLAGSIEGVNKTITASNPKITNCQIDRLDFPNALAEYSFVATKIAELAAKGEDLNEIAVLSPKHKYLAALAPYLSSQNIALRYEKSEDILQSPGIKTLLGLAKLVNAIAKRLPHNDLLFQVLSYEIWGLDTPTVWQLSWQVEREQSWLDFILQNDDFTELRPIVYWLLEFAKIAPKISLEACFDYLIGNSPLTYQIANKKQSFTSPIKQFYQKSCPTELVDFALDVSLLREKFLEYASESSDQAETPLEKLLNLTTAYESFGLKMSRANSYNEASSAVNLMTAFSAKGLEFKHVFLLDTNDTVWGKARQAGNRVSLPENLVPIRHDSETLDGKARLLFVAMTRAKTNLYLLNGAAKLDGKTFKRLGFFEEFSQKTDKGEVWFSQILPAKYAEIKQISATANLTELENNLAGDFSNWQARHLKNTQTFADLLAPKLAKFKLSATAFNAYTNLIYAGPSDYFINNILNFPGSYNLHTIYGICVHYVIEKLQKTGEISPTVALKLFNKRLAEFNLPASDTEQLQKRAEHSLPKFITARAEIFTPAADIEIHSEENYYNSNVVLGKARLTGTIDRLEINKKTKTITIVDFKTGKSFTKLDLNEQKLYHNLKQLYFYKSMLVASKKFPDYRVTGWRLEFVDPDKADQINFLGGEFDSAETERINQLIQAVWQKTMALDFTEPELTGGERANLSHIKKFEQSLLDEAK